MIDNIIKFLYYPFNNIIFFFSFLIPKSKNKWVFGAWMGQRYGDNPKYLFEYVCQNHPEIRAIWISQNKAVISELKNSTYENYYYLTLKGIYHTLTAKIAVVSHGTEDINRLLISSQNLRVQLWHGVGYKKIKYDDIIGGSLYKISTRLKHVVFPFITEKFDMVIATSQETQKQFSKAFRLPIEKVPITGYPRNDIFFNEASLRNTTIRTILYAPTFRKAGEGMSIKSILPNQQELEELNHLLEQINAVFYIKLHFHDRAFLPVLDEYSNISVCPPGDLQRILFETDLLMTDYSSIYFDYLLLDRPIIFTPFDIQQYLRNEFDFHYRYEDMTPGPIAHNWSETFGYIEEELKNPLKYQNERKKIRDLFYQHLDGNSSERVYNEIIRQISQREK